MVVGLQRLPAAWPSVVGMKKVRYFPTPASRWLLVAAAETVPAGVAQIVELMDFGLRAYLGGAAG